MASPRRHSTLIELIRDRPTSGMHSVPVRAERIKPEPRSRAKPQRSEPEHSGGFDIASLGKMFAAGRRLNLPMGYVFIAAALVLISWIGAYSIGYKRAEGAIEAERIARLTTTADPLRSDAATSADDRAALTAPLRTPNSRPTPQVSSNGPTGMGFPDQGARRQQANRGGATANRPASVLPSATFEEGLNYLVIANYHKDEALLAAAFLLENGVQAAVVPVNNGATWRVVGLRGFTGEQMRAGEHRQYRESVEVLGRSWERDHGGSDNFSGMFFRKESN